MIENLWRAVIKQAWDDFFKHQDVEAEKFLFDTWGEWADSRKDICAAIGVDAEALRERALSEELSRQ